MKMKVINRWTYDTIATVITNHGMTFDEVLDLLGFEKIEVEHVGDPELFYNGKEYYYEDLAVIAD